MATWKGNLRAGMVASTVFGLLEGTPKQYVFTPELRYAVLGSAAGCQRWADGAGVPARAADEHGQ
jgi:hypothetical protein